MLSNINLIINKFTHCWLHGGSALITVRKVDNTNIKLLGIYIPQEKM